MLLIMKAGNTNRKIKIKKDTSLPYGNKEIVLEKGNILGVITQMENSLFLSYEGVDFWVTSEEFLSISDCLIDK